MGFRLGPLIGGSLAVALFLMLGLPVEAQLADAEADTAAAGDAHGDDDSSTLLPSDERNSLVAPAALYPSRQ
jgi:hypothetical protein